MSAPKSGEGSRDRTLSDATQDMTRALEEHEPEATVLRCRCGNVAMAVVMNPALGSRYVRCLACGTNVLLRFVDDQVNAGRAALKGGES